MCFKDRNHLHSQLSSDDINGYGDAGENQGDTHFYGSLVEKRKIDSVEESKHDQDQAEEGHVGFNPGHVAGGVGVDADADDGKGDANCELQQFDDGNGEDTRF